MTELFVSDFSAMIGNMGCGIFAMPDVSSREPVMTPPQKLPKNGELFTGLTVEQAVDLAAFLQHYIVSVQSSGSDNQH